MSEGPGSKAKLAQAVSQRWVSTCKMLRRVLERWDALRTFYIEHDSTPFPLDGREDEVCCRRIRVPAAKLMQYYFVGARLYLIKPSHPHAPYVSDACCRQRDAEPLMCLGEGGMVGGLFGLQFENACVNTVACFVVLTAGICTYGSRGESADVSLLESFSCRVRAVSTIPTRCF